MEYAYRKTFKVTKSFFNAPQNIQYVHKYNTLTTLSFKVDVLVVFHVIEIEQTTFFTALFTLKVLVLIFLKGLFRKKFDIRNHVPGGHGTFI